MKKADRERKARIVKDLYAKQEAVEQAVDTCNREIVVAFDKIRPAIDAYNAALEAAKEFADQVAADLQSEFDDRSEKWQESEAGETMVALISEWTALADAEEIAIDDPEMLDMPDTELAAQMENIDNT